MSSTFGAHQNVAHYALLIRLVDNLVSNGIIAIAAQDRFHFDLRRVSFDDFEQKIVRPDC